MITTSLTRAAGVALALTLSTAVEAGGPRQGAGMMPRPHGTVHAAPGVGFGRPPVGRFGFGGGVAPAYRGARIPFGRAGTAAPNGVSRRFGIGFGDAGRFGGYGHVNTGFGRLRSAGRYALRGQRGFGGPYGTGYRGGTGYGYGPGGYDGADQPSLDVDGASSGPAYVLGGGSGSYGSTRTASDEGPFGGGYAEPPLNVIGYGDARILTVGHERARRDGCSCASEGPIVYRFGVGSYY